MKGRVFKYLRVYRTLLANSVSYEAQYRYDTWIKLTTNLLWLGMIFLVIEVVFSQTPELAGWSKPEVYLLTVFWVMVDELYATFFGGNIPLLSEIIVQGDLDAYLAKPLHPLFLTSCKIFLTRSLYRFGVQALILIWLAWRFDFALSGARIVASGFLIAVAVLITYATALIANILSFWFLRIDNINEVLESFTSLGRYPLSIWPKTIRIIALTAIPIAFSGFVPSATLTGRWPWYGVIYACIFAILLFWIAVKFWNFALKRYSSASS